MKNLIACLLTLTVIHLSAYAEEPKWEYRVAPLTALLHATNQEELKAWAKINRPHLFQEIENGGKSGDTKAVDAKGSIIDRVEVAAGVESAMVEFYLNSMGDQGWELMQVSDRMLYFRRAKAK